MRTKETKNVTAKIQKDDKAGKHVNIITQQRDVRHGPSGVIIISSSTIEENK